MILQNNTSSSETLQKDRSAVSNSVNESEKLVVNLPDNQMQTASKAEATKKEQFSLVKSLQGFGDLIGQAAAEVVQGVTQTTVDAVQGATTATVEAAQSAAQATFEVVQGVTKTTADAVQGATTATVEAAQNAAQATFEVVQGVTKTTADAVQGATTATVEAAQSGAQAVSEVAQGTTKAVTDVASGTAKAATDTSQNIVKVASVQNKNNLEAGQASKEASVAAHIRQVNISQIKQTVAALQEKYPNKKPAEISQRILIQQVPLASVIAGAIALVPGKVAEATGIDQASLTLMQAETVYQIAAAYGFDLLAPELKSEVFAIFDRALRASRMARMGLGFMQIIPFAGGVLNAGTDGYVLYLIGDIARNFFESKSQETVTGQHLKSFVQETQKQYKRLW
jgi:uncharacterized protein (DUF697 family)